MKGRKRSFRCNFPEAPLRKTQVQGLRQAESREVMATTEIHPKADLGSLRIHDSHRLRAARRARYWAMRRRCLGLVVIIGGIALAFRNQTPDGGSGDGTETGSRRALGDFECERVRDAEAESNDCGEDYGTSDGRVLR